MADLSLDGLCQRATVSSRADGMVAEDAQTHFDRGNVWARMGAYEQALEAWKQAARLAPEMTDAYAAIGSIYMTLGCWQEAVRSYERAILTASPRLESYYGLGSAYGRLGDYSRAVEAYAQAFKLLPLQPAAPDNEAVAVRLEHPGPEALPPKPVPVEDRIRADAEGFDFSALLSTPAARRKAMRQAQNAAASVTPPETHGLTRGVE
jgi:tetratricopeptide (TPR) repeat protein